MNRFGPILVAVLFFIFGIVQWNDPDPYVWIAMYFYVGISILLYVFTDLAYYPLLLGAIVTLIAFLSYVPNVVDWIESGMPSIVGSMQAESKYIELVREFFGLFISFIALIYYFVRTKNKK